MFKKMMEEIVDTESIMKNISNAGILRKYAATRSDAFAKYAGVSRGIRKKRNYFHEAGKIKILAFIHVKRNNYTT